MLRLAHARGASTAQPRLARAICTVIWVPVVGARLQPQIARAPRLDSAMTTRPTDPSVMERDSFLDLKRPQTQQHAYGTAYLKHTWIDTPLSLLGCAIFGPFIALVLLVTAPCFGPRLYQQFAMWCMTGPLKDSLSGVLLMRLPTFLYDWPMIFWHPWRCSTAALHRCHS